MSSPPLRARLGEILSTNLADDVLAWTLGADGTWEKVPTVAGVDTHRRLGELRRCPGPGRTSSRCPSVRSSSPRSRASDSPSLTDVAEGVIARPDEILELRRRSTTTPPTSDSRAPARACGTATPTAGPSSCPAPVTAMLVRGEHTFPGGPGTPPDAAVDLVRGVRADRARSARRRAPEDAPPRASSSSTPGGKKVAEVVDDEVSVLDDGRITDRFRELEVEIERGRAGRRSPTRSWRAPAGGRRRDRRTRPRRSCARSGRARSRPPDIAPPGRALGRLARARRRATRRSRLGRAACSPTTPASVSATTPSTCTRHGSPPGGCAPTCARSARCSSPSGTRRCASELKWLGARARRRPRHRGAARPAAGTRSRRLTDVDRPVGEHLLGRLVDRWEAPARRAARGDALGPLRRSCSTGSSTPRAGPRSCPSADAPATEVLPPLVQGPGRSSAATSSALPDDPPDEALHDVRIRAKRCRYAAEAVAPALGTDARRVRARRSPTLQDVLGDHQDAVVAAAWLRDVAESTDVAGGGLRRRACSPG